MKIDEMSQQVAVAFVGNVRAEKQSEYQEAHAEFVARYQRATDKVDLSSNIPAAPEAKEGAELRASRVEQIKAEVEGGSYSISARAVAERIVSKMGKPAVN